MHITVQVLPLATGTFNRHFQLPSKGIISLTVLAKPEQTFLSVWSEIERIYARNYVPPGQRSNFQIKKLQNVHGADIDLEFTVGDFFEGETEAKIIRVVQAPIDRETSVLVTSNLRPHLYDFNKRKRVLEEQEETRKRRKQEEEHYGQPLENLDPDRPLRTSEGYLPDGNTFTIQESPNAAGQNARHFHNDEPEDIVIQDSQPNGQMEMEMNGHVNGDSYGGNIIHNGMVQFSPGHIAENNLNPSISPELGDQDFERTVPAPEPVFKKPTLPASGRRIVKAFARQSPLPAANKERAPTFPGNHYAPATYDISDKPTPASIPRSNILQARAERPDVYEEIETLDAESHNRGINQLQSASALRKKGERPAETLTNEGSQQHTAKRLKLGPSTGPSSRNRHPLLQQYTSVSTPKVNGTLDSHNTANLGQLGVATHAEPTAGSDATPRLAPVRPASRSPQYSSPVTSAEKLQRLRERRVSNEDDRRSNVPPEASGNSGNSISSANGFVTQPGQSKSRSLKPDVSTQRDHQGIVETDGELSDEVDDEAYEEASRQIEQHLHEQIEVQSEDDVPVQATAKTSFAKKTVGAKRTVAPNHQQATGPNDQLKSASKRATKWTPEEDQILLTARARGEPWIAVTSHLPGRNTDGLRKRYTRLTGASRPSAAAAELQQPNLQQWLGSDAPDQTEEGSSQKSRGPTANPHQVNGPVNDKTPGLNATKQKGANRKKARPPAKKTQDNISAKAVDAEASHDQTAVARGTTLAAQNPNRNKSKDDVRSLATDGAPRDRPLTGGDVTELLAILAERKAHRNGSSQLIREDARAANELSSSKHRPQHTIPTSRKVAPRPLPRDNIVSSPGDERMPNPPGHSSRSMDTADQQQDENASDLVDQDAVNGAPDEAVVEGSNDGLRTASGVHLENGLEIEESEAGYAEGRTTAAGTIANQRPTANQIEGGHGLDGTQSDEYELPALFDKDIRYFATQSTAAERELLPSPTASVSDRSPARYVSGSPDAEGESSSEGEADSAGQGVAEITDERRSSRGGKQGRVASREGGQEDRNRKKAAEPQRDQYLNATSSAQLVNGDSHPNESKEDEQKAPRPRNAAPDNNTIATAGRLLIDDEAEEASESSSEEESEDEESEGGQGASSEEEEQRLELKTTPFVPQASHKANPLPRAPASNAAEGAATKKPLPPSPRRSPRKASFAASDSEKPQPQTATGKSPLSPRRSPRMAMCSSTAPWPASSISASTKATSQATVRTQLQNTNQRALPPMKATPSSRKGQADLNDRPTTPPPAQSTSDSQIRRSPRLNGALPRQRPDQPQSKPVPRPISAASKFPSRLSELKSRHSTPLAGAPTASTRASMSSSRQLQTISGLGTTHTLARRTTITTATAGKSKSDSESSSSDSSSEDEAEEQTVVQGEKGVVNGWSREHAAKTSEMEKGQKNRYQGLMKSMYNLIGSPFTSSGT